MEISISEFKQAIVNAHIAGQELARVPTKKYAQDYYREFFLQMTGLLDESPNKKLQTESLNICPICKIDRFEEFKYCYNCGHNYDHN